LILRRPHHLKGLRKNFNPAEKLQTLSSRTHSRLREWVRDLLSSCGAGFRSPCENSNSSQRLEAEFIQATYGTAEAVPYKDSPVFA
jgi:hypothetical protein